MKNRTVALLVLTLLCGPWLAAASAQATPRALTTLGGVSVTGQGGTVLTSPAASVRLGLPVGRVLVLEPALTYVPTDTPIAPRSHALLTEVNAQLQWPGERLRPYVGIGAGTRWIIRSGGDGSELALSVGGGVRYLASSDWILRGELRARGNEFSTNVIDLLLGVGRTF